MKKEAIDNQSLNFLNLDVAKISIIISNLIPLIGVLFWYWKVIDVLVFFWIESIVVGFYILVKVIINIYYKISIKESQKQNKNILPEMMNIIKVLIFYSAYVFVHYIIINFIFSQVNFINLMNYFNHKSYFVRISLNSNQIIIPFIVLFISHGISLITNYIKNKEYQKKSTGELINLIYSRIVILQPIIIIGGVTSIIFHSNFAFLIFAMIIKTILDLYTHQKEHA